jgi:hypothetical protein
MNGKKLINSKKNKQITNSHVMNGKNLKMKNHKKIKNNT